ncbi:hypothetical protein BGX31_004786 [Mortierella sp. GBA43]|nr:hypothetical protein BGX31_004786 [Mortierella sp. GBA43]
MPAGVRSGNKDSTWANTANKIADKLEDSAEKLSKDYLREVKHFDNAEDEMVKVYGLTMNSTNISGRATSENNQHHHHHHHNKSGGKGRSSSASSSVMTTFEQLLVDQVQADMIHPDAKPTQNTQHHSHMVSSLLEELKNDQTSNLSKHASDAIRMVESQHVLKQDKAPIHDVRNEDPSEKHLGSLKHA